MTIGKTKTTICAIIMVRNERHHIDRCLDHLLQNQIDCIVIDNGSTDGTSQILRARESRGQIQYEFVPYRGHFDLIEQCNIKSQIAMRNHSDWFIHVDADEILCSDQPGESLREAIERIDKTGSNAINFDEFVFVPASETESHEGLDYVATMKHYYFFEPRPVRLVRAWKPGRRPVDLASEAGHRPRFDGIKIFEKNLALRHYIMLSKEHIIDKYTKRAYSHAEIHQKKWHDWRPYVTSDIIVVPKKEDLHIFVDGKGWDKSKPQYKHLFVKI